VANTKKMERAKITTFYIGESMYAKAKALAGSLDISVADFYRAAIARHIKRAEKAKGKGGK